MLCFGPVLDQIWNSFCRAHDIIEKITFDETFLAPRGFEIFVDWVRIWNQIKWLAILPGFWDRIWTLFGTNKKCLRLFPWFIRQKGLFIHHLDNVYMIAPYYIIILETLNAIIDQEKSEQKNNIRAKSGTLASWEQQGVAWCFTS